MVDIYHSRRTNYHLCEYWIRDERTSTGTPSHWIMYKTPDGEFWAKIVSSTYNSQEQVNNVWMLDSDKLNLETDDDVRIKRGDVVRFNDNLWLVETAQGKPHIKESEFNKEIHYKTTISLTRTDK